MHFKKIIDCPLYRTDILIEYGKAKKLGKKYSLKKIGTDFRDFPAATLRMKDNAITIIFNNKDDVRVSNVAHECVHVKNMVFADVGPFSNADNDEHEAYFISWLMDEILRIFTKKGVKVIS